MNGAILWQGISRLDGKTPVVCIVTGLTIGSTNLKTGHMLQTWILAQDIHPVDAKDTQAVCGNCKHKTGSCYVNIMGPCSVYRAYKAGKYQKLDALPPYRHLRIGAHGDPAAIPAKVWRRLLIGREHTGYTHQWKRFPSYKPFLMASVDSVEEYEKATSQGWRTFRVRKPGQPLLKGEIVCPASKEAGHRLQCTQCRLCNGASRRKNIAIFDHGPKARHENN